MKCSCGGELKVHRIGFFLGSTSYICEACGKTQGFYHAVARNMFPIEKLPDGACPIYMKDSDDSEDEEGKDQ